MDSKQIVVSTTQQGRTQYPEDTLLASTEGWEKIAFDIAQAFEPALGVQSARDTLDEIAAEVLAEVGFDPDPEVCLEVLREVLFVRWGFAGNAEQYYTPDNSFLPAVLASRRGLPLTLSMVMILAARRTGLPLVGLGLPCHFCVGYWNEKQSEWLVLDPFHGGLTRNLTEIQVLVSSYSGGVSRLDSTHFQPVLADQLRLRMLSNLRLAYQRSQDYLRLGQVLVMLAQSGVSVWDELSQLTQNLALTGKHQTATQVVNSFITQAGIKVPAGRIESIQHMLTWFGARPN